MAVAQRRDYFYRYDANDSDGDDRYLSRRYRRVDSFNW